MSRLEQAAQKSYGRHLEQGEKILATAEAFAADTGRVAGYAAAIGALTGALAWTLLEGSGLLPLLVLGACGGIMAGVAIAARRVRGPDGPGALIMTLALTNTRLLLLRRRAAIKVKPLRSFPLKDIDRFEATPAAMGDYQHLVIHLETGPDIRLLVHGAQAVVDLMPKRQTGTL